MGTLTKNSKQVDQGPAKFKKVGKTHVLSRGVQTTLTKGCGIVFKDGHQAVVKAIKHCNSIGSKVFEYEDRDGKTKTLGVLLKDFVNPATVTDNSISYFLVPVSDT